MPYIASVITPIYTRPHSKLTAYARLMGELQETIENKDDVEILVKIDDGDEPALALCQEYAEKYKNFRYYSGPGGGYRVVNTFYDLLAKNSQGQFIVIVPDDHRIQTKGWDKILYNYLDKTTWILKPYHGQPTKGNLSPIMHRRFYEIVGHTGLYPTDWFWDNIQMMYPIFWETLELRFLHDWTGFKEENATDAIQGALRLNQGEAMRIISLIQAERSK